MSRLLVVDDDRATVEALGVLLQMDGYDVVALDSSAEALRRLRVEKFDAVITDLEMPQVHGAEIVRAARAADGVVPVLVVTAYGDSPAARKALACGARRIFPKPVDYGALLADIKLALSGT